MHENKGDAEKIFSHFSSSSSLQREGAATMAKTKRSSKNSGAPRTDARRTYNKHMAREYRRRKAQELGELEDERDQLIAQSREQKSLIKLLKEIIERQDRDLQAAKVEMQALREDVAKIMAQKKDVDVAPVSSAPLCLDDLIDFL
jgi:chromosome segregation ATPase